MPSQRLFREALGVAITTRTFAIGQLVLVRASVAASHAHSAIVRIPTFKLGTELPIEVPICDVFLPHSTDAACDAARMLIEKLDGLRSIGLRVQAEVYELGGHAGQRINPPHEQPPLSL